MILIQRIGDESKISQIKMRPNEWSFIFQSDGAVFWDLYQVAISLAN